MCVGFMQTLYDFISDMSTCGCWYINEGSVRGPKPIRHDTMGQL